MYAMHLESASLLSDEQLNQVTALEALCLEHDKISLKLELDYKQWRSKKESFKADAPVTEFLCYAGELLIGYIGICVFGGGEPEMTGMVHPDYRRQGVFKRLWGLAQAALKCSGQTKALLLCDRKSFSGKGFIESLGLQLDHAEYEMYLNLRAYKPFSLPDITFRQATKADSEEIRRQNAVYFNTTESELDLIDPDLEAERGMRIMLMQLTSGEVIGKTHLELNGSQGAIFGLGVMPEHRGKSYGKGLLNYSVGALLESGAQTVMLQVATENEKALTLYTQTGFEARSTMDYYMMLV